MTILETIAAILGALASTALLYVIFDTIRYALEVMDEVDKRK